MTGTSLRVSISLDLRHPGDDIPEETSFGASPGWHPEPTAGCRGMLQVRGFAGFLQDLAGVNQQEVAVSGKAKGSALRKTLPEAKLNEEVIVCWDQTCRL